MYIQKYIYYINICLNVLCKCKSTLSSVHHDSYVYIPKHPIRTKCIQLSQNNYVCELYNFPMFPFMTAKRHDSFPMLYHGL